MEKEGGEGDGRRLASVDAPDGEGQHGHGGGEAEFKTHSRLDSILNMPGTHLLPPNLLKLFAPRPPLLWLRPVDKDINHVRKKNVAGVAHLLSDLKEADTQHLISVGQAENMEEGEEPVFTHAEEIKRQIRRDERRAKRTEAFKVAKDSCAFSFPLCLGSPHLLLDKPSEDSEAVGDPYKTLFISRLVTTPCSPLTWTNFLVFRSIRELLRATFVASSKDMAL